MYFGKQLANSCKLGQEIFSKSVSDPKQDSDRFWDKIVLGCSEIRAGKAESAG